MRSQGRSGHHRLLSAVVVFGLSLWTAGCAGERATFRIDPEPSDRNSILDDAKIVLGLYSGYELEPGEVNELPPSASRKLGVAVASVAREGVELCSYPRPSDFALRATTPETCVLGARNDRPVFKGLSSVLDDWVELKASGECALEIGVTLGGYRRSVGFTALGVEALEEGR